MVALHEGRTLRTFGIRAPRLEAYFKAHPEYAQQALPLIEKNKAAALLQGCATPQSNALQVRPSIIRRDFVCCP
jgi:hypothetical protein